MLDEVHHMFHNAFDTALDQAGVTGQVRPGIPHFHDQRDAAQFGQGIPGNKRRQAGGGDNDDVRLADHHSGGDRQKGRITLVQQPRGAGVAMAQVGDVENLLSELAAAKPERPARHPAREGPPTEGIVRHRGHEVDVPPEWENSLIMAVQRRCGGLCSGQ